MFTAFTTESPEVQFLPIVLFGPAVCLRGPGAAHLLKPVIVLGLLLSRDSSPLPSSMVYSPSILHPF